MYEPQYLFDTYVQEDLERTLNEVLLRHNAQCILQQGARRPRKSHRRLRHPIISNLCLSAYAELRDETRIQNSSFVYSLQYTDPNLCITSESIGSSYCYVISPTMGNDLTPGWKIWDQNACPFLKPCDVTCELELNSGDIIEETYNIAGAGIRPNDASFVALPSIEISSGDNIRIIFYIAPDKNRYNLLQKIIIYIQPSTRIVRKNRWKFWRYF